MGIMPDRLPGTLVSTTENLGGTPLGALNHKHCKSNANPIKSSVFPHIPEDPLKSPFKKTIKTL